MESAQEARAYLEAQQARLEEIMLVKTVVDQRRGGFIVLDTRVQQKSERGVSFQPESDKSPRSPRTPATAGQSKLQRGLSARSMGDGGVDMLHTMKGLAKKRGDAVQHVLSIKQKKLEKQEGVLCMIEKKLEQLDEKGLEVRTKLRLAAAKEQEQETEKDESDRRVFGPAGVRRKLQPKRAETAELAPMMKLIQMKKLFRPGAHLKDKKTAHSEEEEAKIEQDSSDQVQEVPEGVDSKGDVMKIRKALQKTVADLKTNMEDTREQIRRTSKEFAEAQLDEQACKLQLFQAVIDESLHRPERDRHGSRHPSRGLPRVVQAGAGVIELIGDAS